MLASSESELETMISDPDAFIDLALDTCDK